MSEERDSLEEAFFVVKPKEPPTIRKGLIRVGGPYSPAKTERSKGLVPQRDEVITGYTGVFHGDESERFHLAMDSAIIRRKFAERAKKESVGGKKGGDNRTAPLADRVQEAADAWWKCNPKLSIRRVAEKLANGEKANGSKVATGLFGAAETIRKAIKKPNAG